ncbi:MAG: tRNA (adenosine(37)-N6)-threonylcarbamoyltransferase complex ATPase subunit type 1 TsaE [Clostridia bacterium]|nr:tRNA (adenosine(37)-N6)-threonylcarbamoyltransferase complex ATPase subunit type 1 TsaE [Clostridia bacterium]
MKFLEKITHCADETETVGAEIAKYVLEENESFVALYGDLGAGKTAFTRGFASVIVPDADVCSPTYTIVNEYEGETSLFHFDMYRIEDEDALDSIGFYDYFGRGIIITEWSENIPFALPERYVRVTIEKLGDDERKITAEICGK